MENKRKINTKNEFEQDIDKFLLEKKGIESFFISGIGLRTNRKKNERYHQLKVNIPKMNVEAFQTFALYLMLTYRTEKVDRKPPITKWLVELVSQKIKELVDSKDPTWIEARNLLRDYKFQYHKKLMEQGNKNQ
ncbi:MAG TPA: hypothetical protein VI815_02705 [Candidatus Nanoarchaeia archaeon]|nr:hypothetical protein [Candidatus Nanoarchaeia archaeon]